MWSTFIEFLIRLREDLDLRGPMEKRITVRYLVGNRIRTCTVALDGQNQGTVSLVLRPHIVVHRPAKKGEAASVTSVPLNRVVDVALEQWDLDDPESIVLYQWLRDSRGHLILASPE